MSNSRDVLKLANARALAASGEARARRQAARLSIQDVAMAISGNPSTIWRWETGSRRPRGDVALRWGQLIAALPALPAGEQR